MEELLISELRRFDHFLCKWLLLRGIKPLFLGTIRKAIISLKACRTCVGHGPSLHRMKIHFAWRTSPIVCIQLTHSMDKPFFQLGIIVLAQGILATLSSHHASYTTHNSHIAL